MSLAQCWPRYMRESPGVRAAAYAGTPMSHAAPGLRRLTSATSTEGAANPDDEWIDGKARYWKRVKPRMKWKSYWSRKGGLESSGRVLPSGPRMTCAVMLAAATASAV